MKITLPEHIGEITLKQFQQFDKLRKRTDLNEVEFGKRLIAIFTELKYKQVGNIKRKDYADILEQIIKACDIDGEFKQTFMLDGVKYGFIPNLDKMSMREWTNLQEWEVNKVENYHRIMSILYRPIQDEDDFKNYRLEPFKGTEENYMKMLNMPMDIVNGCLVFFYNLANELETHILVSTNQMEMKRGKVRVGTLRSMVGMQP